jgi:FtsH-binding integral membrane protein
MMTEAATSLAHEFPLIRSGGIFLIAVGAGVIWGAGDMRRRYWALGAGAAIGTLVTALFAVPLAAPYGSPRVVQLISLAAAVGFEVAAIALVARTAARAGERFRTIAILGIVGAHFAIMAPAFGPSVAMLSLLSTGNALLGAAVPRYRLAALWLIDGTLKLSAGAAMFFQLPR